MCINAYFDANFQFTIIFTNMNKIIGLIKTQTMRYLFGAAKNKKAASDYISSEDLPLVLNDNLRFNA